MGIKDLAAQRTKTSGGSTENVVVQITEYNLVDKAKSNGDKDFVTGILQAPACGLEAGSVVKVRMRPDPDASKREGDNKRRDIQGLTKKAGSGDAVKVGGLVEFERVYLDKDGSLNAGWLKAMVCDSEAGNEHCFSAVFAMVDRERKPDNGNAFQILTMADCTGSMVVKNEQELISALTTILSVEGSAGTLGMILRAIDLNDGTRAAARWSQRSVKDGAGVYQRESAEVTIENFLKSEHGGGIVEYLKTYPNAVYEVIPTMSFPLGKKTVASNNERGIDLSKNYQITLVDGAGKETTTTGFAVSNVQIRAAGEGDTAFWYGATSKPSLNGDRRQTFDIADLPTPGMPANILEQVNAAAKERKVIIGGAAAPAEEAEFGGDAAPGLNA